MAQEEWQHVQWQRREKKQGEGGTSVCMVPCLRD
jgi:hypothetical protein